MDEMLERLETELNALDAGRLTIRVEGTFLSEEIAAFLGHRQQAKRLKKRLE